MFPQVSFLGITLYWWLILIGIIVAIALLRIFSDKLHVSAKVYNFTLLTAVLTLLAGFAGARLFQMMYNFLENGDVNEGGGYTFYGGLIVGAVFFIAFYLIAGMFVFKKKEHLSSFFTILSMAIVCVVIAHGFGRIGCLFAGCCHGVPTDSWIGIEMVNLGEKVVPTQLFEAIFLFLFFGYLLWMLLKKKNEYILSQYLIGYGVWRYIIEFWRGDPERGASFVEGISPSQYTSFYMVGIGIALIFVYKYWLKDFLPRYVAQKVALAEALEAQKAEQDKVTLETKAEEVKSGEETK